MVKESQYLKLRIMVPIESADMMREVLGKAGAGTQGNYQYCTGSYRQTGRFLPMSGANPVIGEVGKMESIEEEVIETLCSKEIVEEVIIAVKKAHPYEEPAIDVIPLLEVQ